jgi:small-conductance mechanosensitive channel
MLVFLLLLLPLFAQEAAAPVLLDGHTLFIVKAPVGAYTAERRASDIAARIAAASEEGLREVTLDEQEYGTAVVAGGKNIMLVTDADARAENRGRLDMARERALIVSEALRRYEGEHSWRYLALAMLRALAAWAVFLLIVFAVYRALRWTRLRLEAWYRSATEARMVRGLLSMLWQRMVKAVVFFMRFAAAVVVLVLLSSLLTYTLAQFPSTANISVSLIASVRGMLSSIVTSVAGYLPKFLVLLVIIAATNYLLGLIKVVAQGIEEGDLVLQGFHQEWAQPTYSLVRVMVIAFAAVVSFPYLPGGDSDAFKMVSIFFGVLLSLGSSSAVSSVIAGVILTYMRPFRIGDRIQVGEMMGDVLERTLLVVRIRTIKNVEVTIPNSTVLTSHIQNFSGLARVQGLILHTTVTIGYDAPWRTVHELMIDAAKATSGILAEPAPFVLQTALNDFNVSYQINAYTDRPNDMINIYSELHRNIQDKFNAGGVEIMSPSYYALRDGNTVTIPEPDRPRGYEAPGFRVQDINPPRP